MPQHVYISAKENQNIRVNVVLELNSTIAELLLI